MSRPSLNYESADLGIQFTAASLGSTDLLNIWNPKPRVTGKTTTDFCSVLNLEPREIQLWVQKHYLEVPWTICKNAMDRISTRQNYRSSQPV
jgi:hypothetical protein